MSPFMQLKGDDILEVSLLSLSPMAYPTPVEEAVLMDDDDPKPQEAKVTTTCPSNNPEQAPQPKSAARLGWTVAGPQGAQAQPLLPPPGFNQLSLASRPPPLKNIKPRVKIPIRAWQPNFHGFYADGHSHSQEWINRWAWMLLWNVGHLMPMPEPAWDPMLTWYQLRSNGPVNWVSTHS